jgi:hypothetical protein
MRRNAVSLSVSSAHLVRVANLRITLIENHSFRRRTLSDDMQLKHGSIHAKRWHSQGAKFRVDALTRSFLGMLVVNFSVGLRSARNIGERTVLDSAYSKARRCPSMGQWGF